MSDKKEDEEGVVVGVVEVECVFIDVGIVVS